MYNLLLHLEFTGQHAVGYLGKFINTSINTNINF